VKEDFKSVIEQMYASTTNMKGSFEQHTYVSLLDRSIKARGKFIFKQPGKVYWEYLSPHRKKYISDGDTLWVYDPQDKQVLIGHHQKERSKTLAMDFLWSLAQISNAFTEVPMNATEQAEIHCSKKMHCMKLIPKDEVARMNFLLIALDRRSLYVKELMLYNKNGNRVRYKFKDIKRNTKISGSIFSFTPPPGTQSIKIR